MARMLFLRDIDADVQLRCLACGHGGVLPRAMLERRFGPNYPVLSIAPHYRCSRCDSRDIESRPILAVPQDTVPAPTNDEPSFDAPLAALNGLLASLRGDSGTTDGRTTDTVPPAPPPPPPPAPVRGKPVSELPLSDLVADGPGDDAAEPLWEPVSLADMAARLGRTSPPDEWDDEPPAKEARAPANDERPEPARVDASEDGDSEDGDDETLMAMRQLLAQAYGSDDELDGDQEDDRYYGVAPKPSAGRAASPGDRHASIDDFAVDDFADKSDPGHGEDEPPAFTHKVLVRRDFEDDWSDGDADAGTDPWRADSGDDDPEDGFDDREPDGPDNGEPSEDEILSFAIRDPEKPARTSRPAKPEPLPAAEPLDFDQHRAERRAQRPPPPPEDEEGFDRTLAALRSMIEDAANEPAEEDAPSPPHKTARSMGHTGGQTANRSAAKSVDKTAREEEDDPAPGRDEDEWSLPAGWDDSDPAPEPAAPEPEPAGRRSAQEREIEEAMKALRGLIEDEAQPDPRASQPPPPQPKPRAGKPRPARGGPAAPEAPPPDASPDEAKSAKPGSEPTPLSKTIAALRGMLELDGRRKR